MQRLFNQATVVFNADADARRRGRILIILSLVMMVVCVFSTPLILLGPAPLVPGLIVAVGFVIMLAAGVVGRFGYVLVGGLLLVAAVNLPPLLILVVDRSQPLTMFYFAFSIIVAGLVLPPTYVWLALGLVLAGLFGLSVSAPELLAQPAYQIALWNTTFFLITIATLVFAGSWVTNATMKRAREAQFTAEAAAQELVAINAALDDRVAARTSELAAVLGEAERRAAEQEQLIRENEYQRVVIRELSVPVLPISATTLVMPLVGALDSARLANLQEQSLTAIEEYGARRLLLDITGVPVVDTQVAQGLIRVVEAARLLGAEVVLVGVRPEVAQAVVGLGVNLASMRSYSDLRSALLA